MADAKEILGLPKVSFVVGSEKRSKPPKENLKKPDGVSREVYALTGGLPPIMPAVDAWSLKKRHSSSNKKISWQWLPFTSSARKDNLQVYHWVKVVDGAPPTGDYQFARYNKVIDIVRYTDEEYAKLLIDSNWTREETDQLFNLCEQFDLRFIVIADRFHPPRTVEELKSRYYSAAKAIILARASTPEEVVNHTLVKDSYNTANEIERKRALGAVLSQSCQQARDDVEVFAETRHISEGRLAKKQIIDDADHSGDADVMEKGPSTPVRPGSPLLLHPSRPSVTTSIPSLMAMPAPNMPRLPRVYMRAGMLAQMVQALIPVGGTRLLKRVEQVLEEYGVQAKPRVPTQAVCSEYLELRKDVLTLLNLKKLKADLLNRGDHERGIVRGGDLDGFPGERSGKREHKRKAPARFLDGPPSPPSHKRARKLKASDG